MTVELTVINADGSSRHDHPSCSHPSLWWHRSLLNTQPKAPEPNPLNPVAQVGPGRVRPWSAKLQLASPTARLPLPWKGEGAKQRTASLEQTLKPLAPEFLASRPARSDKSSGNGAPDAQVTVSRAETANVAHLTLPGSPSLLSLRSDWPRKGRDRSLVNSNDFLASLR